MARAKGSPTAVEFQPGKPKRTTQGNGTNSRAKRGKKKYRGQGK